MKIKDIDILTILNEKFTHDDLEELYKALIAYELGYSEITEDNEEHLKGLVDFYYNNSAICGFINDELRLRAIETLED